MTGKEAEVSSSLHRRREEANSKPVFTASKTGRIVAKLKLLTQATYKHK